MSLDELTALAGSSAAPVFWAGPKSGSTYELTKTADGRVFIRYLPRGVAVGSDSGYLTIGTYPVARAFSVTRSLAHRSGSVQVSMPGVGVAFYEAKSPTNVYFAYPGSGYQVEVYDPSAAQAQSLVTSGQIAPVTSVAPSKRSLATAVTLPRLRAMADSLGHAVYWAGARGQTTYEVSQSPGNRIFVRYLPRGVEVGSDKPYLTIGTYRVANAYTITRSLARHPGSVRVATRDGSVAFYSQTRPTNVYMAYPGSDIQIEVYDPSAGVATGLVGSQSIVPVH